MIPGVSLKVLRAVGRIGKAEQGEAGRLFLFIAVYYKGAGRR